MLSAPIDRFERIDIRLCEPLELKRELRLEYRAVVCHQFPVIAPIALAAGIDEPWREVIQFR